MKKKLSRNNPGDKKGNARPDTTALLCNLNAYCREMKGEPFSINRDPCHLEEYIGHLRGTYLQKKNDPFYQQGRDRNQKKEEQKGEHP